VKLINLDGLAFIGPGSEWFWTAISGLILAVTFIAIYRQLRMQSAATAVEQLEEWEREGGSESLNQASLDILIALRDGCDPAHIPAKAARELGGLWERHALHYRAGRRDPKLLWQWESDAAQGWWLMLGPRVRRLRAETGDPSILENLEWLAALMARMDKRAGRPATTSWEYVTENLDWWIEAHEDRLRTARAARTVLYLPADAVGAPQPPLLPSPPAAPDSASVETVS
jgi:hypothetical protein